MQGRRGLALFVGAALALACVTVIGVSVATVEAGYHDKKMLPFRWHFQPDGDYASWMTLKTDDVYLDCDTSPASCGTKWRSPFGDAIADWNAQPITADFDYQQGVVSPDSVVAVFVEETVPIAPGLLGIAPSFDQDGHFCGPGCSVYAAIVFVVDDAHDGPYGTPAERRATIAHELGHVLDLAHESVNDDESVQYECGMDDTGAIPFSLMSYDCIDPAAVGGMGINSPQPWDNCGVNAAYYDPTIGFADCDIIPSTPTPTPPPVEAIWGDNDCGGSLGLGDAISVARHLVGLGFSVTPPCPEMGAPIVVGGVSRVFGDNDCSNAVTLGDAINISRHLVDLATNHPGSCPLLGSSVVIITGSPTASPSPTSTAPAGLNHCEAFDPPVDLPDNDADGVDLTLNIPENEEILSAAICVDVNHTRVGDLEVTMTHETTHRSAKVVDRPGSPAGSGNCSGNGDGLFVFLSDDTGASIADACASFESLVGYFDPDHPMSGFEGENVHGDWVVKIADRRSGISGEVLGSTLYYMYSVGRGEGLRIASVPLRVTGR